jgi:hypothetical protein
MMMSELKVLFDKRAAALATVAATEAKLSELSRAHIAAGGLTRPQIGALLEARRCASPRQLRGARGRLPACSRPRRRRG